MDETLERLERLAGQLRVPTSVLRRAGQETSNYEDYQINVGITIDLGSPFGAVEIDMTDDGYFGLRAFSRNAVLDQLGKKKGQDRCIAGHEPHADEDQIAQALTDIASAHFRICTASDLGTRIWAAYASEGKLKHFAWDSMGRDQRSLGAIRCFTINGDEQPR